MNKSKVTPHCDLVIIGAGFAGLSAALVAGQTGARITVLGRKNLLASNSALSGGAIALVNTPLQRQRNIQDSAQLFSEDLIRMSRHTIPEDEIIAVAEESTKLYDWLVGLGASFYTLRAFPRHTVERVHLEGGMSGANILQLLYRAASSRNNIEIHLDTLAEHLYLDSQGQVTGVQAINNGRRIEIKSSKAVIIAAGGFGKNKIMMAEYLPNLMDLPCYSGAGSTGDGIRMGIEAGAALHNIDAAGVTSVGSAVKGFDITGTVETLTKGAILVNKNGKRFVDESQGYVMAAMPLMRQPDGVALLVMDEKILQAVEKMKKLMNKYMSIGIFYYGETAPDLARAAGLSYSQVFQETVDQVFASGKLYGAWVRAGMVQTKGGLKVNGRFQVIHKQGYTIPHLFAAGDSTPSLGGAATPENPCPGYLTGTGCLLALASGRIAGRNAILPD
jgi:fumarate reductase flavoprotein subunit